jgi:tetratricopeptide (TPR) repeat protein
MDAAITSALAADIDAARLGFQRVLSLAARDADPGDAWHRARARLGLATLEPSHQGAHADLLAALRDAEVSGDTLLAADVLALLVYVEGEGPDDPARALDLVPAALGKLTALGLASGRRARDIHLSAALASVQAGQLEHADEHLARAAALGADIETQTREDLIRAQLAERRGDLPAAIRLTRVALERQRTLGPATRPVADTLRTLATLQARTGDPDAATTYLEALQIYEDRLGPDLPGRPDRPPRPRHAPLRGRPTSTRAREHAAPISRALARSRRPPADLAPRCRAPARQPRPRQPPPPRPPTTTSRALRHARGPNDVPAAIAGDRWLARLGLARAQLASRSHRRGPRHPRPAARGPAKPRGGRLPRALASRNAVRARPTFRITTPVIRSAGVRRS